MRGALGQRVPGGVVLSPLVLCHQRLPRRLPEPSHPRAVLQLLGHRSHFLELLGLGWVWGGFRVGLGGFWVGLGWVIVFLGLFYSPWP